MALYVMRGGLAGRGFASGTGGRIRARNSGTKSIILRCSKSAVKDFHPRVQLVVCHLLQNPDPFC